MLVRKRCRFLCYHFITSTLIIRLLSFLPFKAGQTDEVKGTGVWSAFELKRDNEEEEEAPGSGKKDEVK